MREILDSLKQLIISLLPRQPLFAEVISYDEATNTITVKPTTDSANIEGVSLDAQGDKDKGFFAIPKNGSDVLVGFVDNEPYVKMYSEVDSVLLKGNTFGGLIKIDSMKSQYDSNLLNIKTSLQTTFNSIDGQLAALGQVGNSNTLFTTQWNALVLDLNKTALENTNVKHG